MKKEIRIVLSLFVALVLLPVGEMANAHIKMLDVSYDNCVADEYTNVDNIGDGIDEKWYELIKNQEARHISQSENLVTEIRYYISPTGTDESTTWTSGISKDRQGFVDDFVNSMKKWNEVYYYILDSSGMYCKKKLVNIVEGDANNHNLIIYPSSSTEYYAETFPLGTQKTIVETKNNVRHVHYEKWAMRVSVSAITKLTEDNYQHIMNRTGAHEIGHILGLRDIDSIENRDSNYYHHEEILMGYSKRGNIISRQTEITYRDIAGVAITRGYHTDSDHRWMLDRKEMKLICSICNGVKKCSSVNNIEYVEYGACNSDHRLNSGNMMPVACIGKFDYYKCKYCRYVAPYTMNSQQDYAYKSFNSQKHIATNNIAGLEYELVENHEYNFLTKWLNNTQHRINCICGENQIRTHVVLAGSFNGQFGKCIICGGRASIGMISLSAKYRMTTNNSYILPNGIIVLAEKDLEDFENGELIFYDSEYLKSETN